MRRSIGARRWVQAAAAAALAIGSALVPVHRATAAASPWAANPQSQVRLISAWRVAPRGGELRLGLQFRLAPHWHVYWKNSGDAGYAPAVAFAKQPGLAYPELLWPAPHRYELAGGLEAFGYEGEVVYPVRATLGAGAPGDSSAPGPSGAPGDHLRLTADVDYLTCQVDCVPHRYTLTLDQELGDRPAADPDTGPLLDRWWREVPLAAERQPGVHAAATMERAGTDGMTVVLELAGAAAAPGGADLFFETDPVLELGRPRVRATPAGLRFEVPAHRKDTSVPLPAATALVWTATGLRLGGGAAALTARQPLELSGAPAAPPTPAALTAATAATAAVATAPAAPDRIRTLLAARDPRLVGLAAGALALLTLDLWGLLRRRGAGPAGAFPSREALGFVALLLTLGLLYALSLEVSPEGLAGTELALLAMGLLAWLWRRTRRTERAPS